MSGLVTAVLCAAFDDATDVAVLAVRETVSRTGVRLPTRPRHRPHITLAAVRVHPAQLADVTERLHAAVDGIGPVPCTLGRVGRFGRAGALWLGPDDATDLRTLQRSVHATAVAGPWPTTFDARSAPETWVPHCSLATRLDPVTLARAETEVRTGFSPLGALVAGVALLLVGGAGDVGLVPLGDAQPQSWPGPSK